MRPPGASLAGALEARLGARGVHLSLVVLSLVASLAIKRHYASATANELRFILAPSAWLSATLLRRAFVWVPDAGYFSDELSFLIAPACAGVNFLVIAFVVLFAGFGRRLASTKKKLLWLAGSALGAYVAAVFVNAIRIALSVALAHDLALVLGLSFQAAHRLVGVSVYFGGLLVLVFAVDRAFRPARDAARSRSPLVLALGAYLAVTLLVPLAHGAGAAPEYWDHARTVAPLALALGALAFGAHALARTVRQRVVASTATRVR